MIYIQKKYIPWPRPCVATEIKGKNDPGSSMAPFFPHPSQHPMFLHRGENPYSSPQQRCGRCGIQPRLTHEASSSISCTHPSPIRAQLLPDPSLLSLITVVGKPTLSWPKLGDSETVHLPLKCHAALQHNRDLLCSN